MTELIAIREQGEYFRFTPDGYERCSMNKATVYPMSKVDEAKSAFEELLSKGLQPQLVKLVITEEPFP